MMAVKTKRNAGELQGQRQGLGHEVDDPGALPALLVAAAADGAAALGLDEGGAEVALQHLAQIAEILDRDRVPEAHVAGRLLDHGVGRHGPEDDARRITRHRAQQREDRERDEQHDQHALRKAPGEEGEREAQRG